MKTQSHSGTKTKEGSSLTSAQLAERADLVAVDGVLYDLRGFARVHPGGASIQAAGAYDASPLFHSMHPGRDPLKSELLQKFRVGTHVRDARKGDVVYCYDSPFAQDLLKSVRKAMAGRSWYAPIGFYARAAAIVIATLWCEWNYITSGRFLWGAAVGILHALIGLSIQHDGSHGAVSSRPWLNALMAYGADWVGNSRWIWLQQHILWHHPYTNVHGKDPDAQSAEPFLLFHSYKDFKSGIARWYHKWQHVFVYPVLSLYGPSVVYNPAFLSMRHNDNIPLSTASGEFMEMQKTPAIAFRLFYIIRVVLLPCIIGGASIFASFFTASICAGIVLTSLFVISHNFVGSDREPITRACVAEGKKHGPPTPCWYKAEVETSCTYGGTLGMLMTGGLNMQIEHHIFPRLNSFHYPVVQQAVKQCCMRHGVRYTYYENIIQNCKSMLTYMHQVGVSAALQEAMDH